MPILYIEPIHAETKEPVRATTHAANLDVHADITGREIICFSVNNTKFTLLNTHKIVLNPGDRAMVPTGYKMRSEMGYKIEVYPRSGNSFKFGIGLTNSVGQVDVDFKDEVMVLLVNTSNVPVTIHHGDRIAQIGVVEALDVCIHVGVLPPIESTRSGGFGSSGKGALDGT